MLKGLLCDLDGTLVDSHAANVEAYCASITHFGLRPPRDRIAELAGTLSWRPMLTAALGPIGDDTLRAIAEHKRANYSAYFGMISVNEHLRDLLVSVRGSCATALVTSASAQSCKPLLQALDLGALFDAVVTSDDCARHKPDPEPFHVAARLLGVEPKDCLVFEDSDVGLAAARAFGGQVVQIHWLPHPASPTPAAR